MKFLTVRELRGNAAAIWKQLPSEHEMVVTNNGKPVAILSAVGEADLEESLSSIRRARAMSAVARMQSRSVERGLENLSAKEIEAEIAAVRRGRSK
ncbi:MAG TPA: prevent-host-death protein [Verrucomicrobia bacterium]|nr:MAG: prevent-host-death protein [Lentisphaerae bacterium GWF2_57_35]HBA84792.1 prevent-host-death protein [Verrucomicrobiota bacterium]